MEAKIGWRTTGSGRQRERDNNREEIGTDREERSRDLTERHRKENRWGGAEQAEQQQHSA